MRELTRKELHQVAGGLKVTDLPPVHVRANPGSGGVDDGGGGWSDPFPPSSGDGGGRGHGGGGGFFPGGFAAGAYKHTTPNGHKYSMQMLISGAQYEVLDAIVDYGYAHSASQQAIQIAAEQAYYESSFGQSEKNPTSSATGLFQYMPSTWSESGFAGSINSDADQMTAIYQDIAKYQQRYDDGQAAKSLPSSLTFGEYFEVKHHLGNNSTSFNDPVVSQYNDAALKMSFHTADQ